MTGFYDAGALGAIGRNLFYGYGYNSYREENQLRADDQQVRALVCDLLGQAHKAVVAAEGAFRRERIPAPTRTNPFPPAEVIADAKRLESLGQAISSVEGQVRHAAVPENDRMIQRFRAEAATLAALIDKDTQLLGIAETIRVLVARAGPDQVLAAREELEQGLAALAQRLAERGAMLL